MSHRLLLIVVVETNNRRWTWFNSGVADYANSNVSDFRNYEYGLSPCYHTWLTIILAFFLVLPE